MTTPAKRHHRLIASLVLLLIFLAAGIIYFGTITRTPPLETVKVDGMYLTTPKAMIDFQLTDNRHKPFTQKSLEGHWTLLFFGFTNCGMVCPTTMAALNSMYKTLQADLPVARLPEVVMVSVDPDRDSVERMNEYVNAFNPHFKGARAEMPQIEALEKALHLVAVKMQSQGSGKNNYTINHSAEIMVINPAGELQAFLSYPHKADELVQDYKTILAATPNHSS